MSSKCIHDWISLSVALTVGLDLSSLLSPLDWISLIVASSPLDSMDSWSKKSLKRAKERERQFQRAVDDAAAAGVHIEYGSHKHWPPRDGEPPLTCLAIFGIPSFHRCCLINVFLNV